MDQLVEAPKVLITDYDRTLIYLYRDTNLLLELADIVNELYSRYFGVPKSLLEINKDGYMLWHKLHILALERLTIDLAEDVNRQAEDSVTNFERRVAGSMKLLHGVSEAIREIHLMGIRLGIVSSNATSVVKYSMEDVGVVNMFGYIAGREYPFNPKLVKPSPFPIDKAVSIMEADRASTWYVGDDVIDMKAAKAAGVTAVGVCTGRHSELELRENGANLVLESFTRIPNFLKGK